LPVVFDFRPKTAHRFIGCAGLDHIGKVGVSRAHIDIERVEPFGPDVIIACFFRLRIDEHSNRVICGGGDGTKVDPEI
jgi:hypothetical protein